MRDKLEKIKKIGKKLVTIENELLEELYDEFSKVLSSNDSLSMDMYYDEDEKKVVLKINISFSKRGYIKRMVKTQYYILDFLLINSGLKPVDYMVDDISRSVYFEFKY